MDFVDALAVRIEQIQLRASRGRLKGCALGVIGFAKAHARAHEVDQRALPALQREVGKKVARRGGGLVGQAVAGKIHCAAAAVGDFHPVRRSFAHFQRLFVGAHDFGDVDAVVVLFKKTVGELGLALHRVFHVGGGRLLHGELARSVGNARIGGIHLKLRHLYAVVKIALRRIERNRLPA